MTPIKERLSVIQGDITTLAVDAIVNAANARLLGGGGVDGAIHHAAGPELLDACRKLHGCATGYAKITPGFALPSRWVIHAVGPIWQGGTKNEDTLLASAYRRSLEEAIKVNAHTVAFAAISTGVYGFPAARAARIAVDTVSDALAEQPDLNVILVAFSVEAATVLQHAVEHN